MSKSSQAFRTISEVADWIGVPTHVLRFWESKFQQIKPAKGSGGRRYYRPEDMHLIGGIHQLLREDGLTIKGAQKILRERGVDYVSARSPELDLEQAPPKTESPNALQTAQTSYEDMSNPQQTQMSFPTMQLAKSLSGELELALGALGDIHRRLTTKLEMKNVD